MQRVKLYFVHYSGPANPGHHTHRQLNITGNGISTLAENGSPEQELSETIDENIMHGGQWSK